MFGISFPEFAVIALIALIIFGPRRLPHVARSAGRAIQSARTYIAKAMESLDEEAQAVTAFASELSSLTPRGIVTQVFTTSDSTTKVTSPTTGNVRPVFDPDAT